MALVPFTQYLRPHGERRTIFTTIDDDLAPDVFAAIDYGYRFECEMLSNGLVHMTFTGVDYDMEDPEEQDVLMRITPNDEHVTDGVAALINDAVKKVDGWVQAGKLPQSPTGGQRNE